MKEKLQKVNWLLSRGKQDLSWMLANHDDCDGFPMAHCDIAHDNVEEALALIDSILAELDSPLQNELLPCPFCGSKSITEKIRTYDMKTLHEIRCDNSDCSFQPESRGGFPTQGMAIEAWNARKQP